MSNTKPPTSSIPVGGSETGVLEIAVAETVEVYTPRLPSGVPSMFKVKSESEYVGSLVENSGRPVFGSRRKTDKASRLGLPGPLVVASSRKEMVVPSVMSVRYSLKNDDGESIRVTVPGRVPVTSPVGETVPRVPSLEKSEMVTVLDVDPPLIKSKTRSAEVPAKLDVLIVTRYVESAKRRPGLKSRLRRTNAGKTALLRPVLSFLIRILPWANQRKK